MAAALPTISAIGRTGAAGVALGATQGAYEGALKFCRERVLYGKPISDLQAVQFMLVDMINDIEAARWICYRPAVLLDQGKSAKDIGVDIARAKFLAVDVALTQLPQGPAGHGRLWTVAGIPRGDVPQGHAGIADRRWHPGNHEGGHWPIDHELRAKVHQERRHGYGSLHQAGTPSGSLLSDHAGPGDQGHPERGRTSHHESGRPQCR